MLSALNHWSVSCLTLRHRHIIWCLGSHCLIGCHGGIGALDHWRRWYGFQAHRTKGDWGHEW